jgi:phage replication-related protein YjqB (UPF0714/DUF867 family)
MDKYSSFNQLGTYEQAGVDYRVRWRIGNSRIAILSIHGGEIEPGTSRIADAIAGSEHTFYALEGLKKGGNRALHITSTLFDEPTALEIVCCSEIIISIHGCAEMDQVVYVGGRDLDLRQRIQSHLHKAGFKATDSLNPRFVATDLANICNLCCHGMGVQLEISRGLRSQMFRNLTPEGRKYPTEIFFSFTRAVRDAIEPFGGASIEEAPLEPTD